jgi:hypothetical protein
MIGDPYLEHLQTVIKKAHGVRSIHLETVAVVEHRKGKIIWEGVVEAFHLVDHPKSKKCYAWTSYENGQEHTTTVIEVHPVISPQTAVKAAVANELRSKQAK